MTSPDPLDFDIVAELRGFTRPTSTITVYSDEKAALELNQVTKEISDRKSGSKTPVALQKKLDAAKEKVLASGYTFEITSLSGEEVEELEDETFERYPRKYTGFGMLEPNADRDKMFQVLLWSNHVVAITNSKGNRTENITPDVAASIRSLLPRHSRAIVQGEINRLVNDAAAGLDFVMADIDFLSQHSPEA